MKRLFALVVGVAILAAAAVPTLAQQRNCRRDSRTSTSRGITIRRGIQLLRQCRRLRELRSITTIGATYDYGYDNRSFWQKHRDKLTVAIGAGAGAALGAMLGENAAQQLARRQGQVAQRCTPTEFVIADTGTKEVLSSSVAAR
jgi:hypothetical protein